MSLPERLKSLRLETGLTQQEISDRLNMNRATYAHYETGRRMPDLDTVDILAKFYGCSMAYLMGETEMRKIQQNDTTANKEPKSLEDYIQEAESLMLYGEIVDEKDKEAILTAIKIAYETAIKKNKDQNKDNK